MGKPCNHASIVEGCRLCHLAENDSRYQEMWGLVKKEGPTRTQCVHLGGENGSTVSCPTCRGRVELKLFDCAIYGQCTLVKAVNGAACCNGTRNEDGNHEACPSFSLEEIEKPRQMTLVERPSTIKVKPLKWAYGVTTVPMRRDDLLPNTLNSLASAGFDKPRLFVDGSKDAEDWERRFGLEVTARFPTIRTHGNWVLSLYELFIRTPDADRYAVFQDDFSTYRNLKTYLEVCPYPENGYLNLYTFPENQKLAAPEGLTGRQRTGWYPSNQFGRGAVALVFNRQAVLTLLASQHMTERPLDPNRGWKAVDGGVVTAFQKAGWVEYVHNPSLVQHTGMVSSMRNKPHKLAESFRGEGYDALDLIGENPAIIAGV